MYDAILSSEDPRFYQEGGVDLIGTARALVSNLKGQSNIQGGSSISQQYVKNVLVQDCYTSVNEQTFKDDKAKKITAQQQKDAALQACYTEATNSSGATGYTRKLQEMRYAIALSQKYSKDEVLLAYLNIANFGGVTYGIEAASEYYFGVHASQLNLDQAATLAGMVQNPNTFRIDQPNNKANGTANKYALTKQRQEYVLGRMQTLGRITPAEYTQAMKDPIAPKITQTVTGCATTAAPYYCAYVKSIITSDPAFGATQADRDQALRQGGLNVYTTLDWRLQNVAQADVSQHAPSSWPGFDYGSVAVNVQPGTGDILSIAQNTTYTDAANPGPGMSGIVYAGDARQSSKGFPAGSSFKLFTLLDWLEKGHTLNQVVDGVKRLIPRLTNSCQGNWINYQHETIPNFGTEGAGFVGTPLQFTKVSLNTGFIGMAQQLDMCDVMRDASKLGVTRTDGTPVQMNTLSSVIGTNPVSPIAMAAAYAAIANKGIFCQPQAIARVTDAQGNDRPIPKRTCTQQVDPGIAATAIYDLQTPLQPGGTAYQGNPQDGTPLFAKTGTNNGDQTWLIESSTAMTSLVWSGTVNHGYLGDNLDLFHMVYRGTDLASIRYAMAKELQTAANQLYPGGPLPAPIATLVTGAPPPPAAPPAAPPSGNGGGNNNGGGNGGGGNGGGNAPPPSQPPGQPSKPPHGHG
jgi:membrane peptidoglycan carboxypeptidase